MSITNELVAHHATLRQLYAQSEIDPKVFDEFTRHLSCPSHHGRKILLRYFKSDTGS